MENIFYKLEKIEDFDKIKNDFKKRNNTKDFFFSVKIISSEDFYRGNIEIIRDFEKEFLKKYSNIKDLEIIDNDELIYEYISNSEYFKKTIQDNSNFENKLLTSNDEVKKMENVNVMTFGTFDLFHVGHKKIINNSKKFVKGSGKIFIGVSSDEWNKIKGKTSIENQKLRVKRVKENFPDAVVFLEDHKKAEETWPQLWDEYNIDLIVMGSDHIENLSYINNLLTPGGRKMRIVFFERTPNISTTNLKNMIK